ncbi:MAG TPA: T9SS type A sorting domain-containing protein [Flavobacteriales bacterium]|nr:T9SS type A sorting domain-containing protein [Flavobacteriales bacterium]
MKTRLLIVTASVVLTHALNAQYTLTDSLNLGEDSTTHAYMAVGNVAVGSYGCGADTSVRVGNGSGGDYIEFNMAVTTNTDSLKIEITMPWHGGSPGDNPKIWLENTFNDTVPYNGTGSCVPGVIVFGGVSTFTADGMVTVKLLDSLAGFPMDGQFTWIKVYSHNPSGLTEIKSPGNFDIYPNPNAGIFNIGNNMAQGTYAEIYNAVGTRVWSAHTSGSRVDVSNLSPGMYIFKTGHLAKRFIIR